jgi:hypothetical protein
MSRAFQYLRVLTDDGRVLLDWWLLEYLLQTRAGTELINDASNSNILGVRSFRASGGWYILLRLAQFLTHCATVAQLLVVRVVYDIFIDGKWHPLREQATILNEIRFGLPVVILHVCTIKHLGKRTPKTIGCGGRDVLCLIISISNKSVIDLWETWGDTSFRDFWRVTAI